ncbi:hypothetical protein [Bradyrhizobium sp. BR 10289]|uniref:hypothetical protein n=1 Tax=Bradyrhizobium sp. BR 10289 TaxID=2749993 RepID=UPI001C651656|nr:hypothetical protein [Bradyrhizobium sp. BR 10289]MBW7967889.1 hypothetical protein [Bradyrhizobium sp. BR 10289]
MLKVMVAALALAFINYAAAQQLRPHGAWDGRGPDPEPQPKRQASPKRNNDGKTATTGAVPLRPSVDERSPSWTLEKSAEDDVENLQLKRSTQICRGC